MNYYLLDDDMNIIQMLKRIIESTMDRDVLGFATDPIEACDEIEHLRPDVLIIDYLMPDLHGVDAILRLKERLPNLKIIMLSQVTDKFMVADSYAAGTDFFITKPINKIEVTRVLDQIERTIEMERTLERISGLLDIEPKQKRTPGPGERASTILRELGILGEKGAEDLLEIVSLSAEHPSADPGDLVDVYIARTGGKRKIVLQRIRRSLGNGLENLAHLALEDFYHESVQRYARDLYDFSCLRMEMDRLRDRPVKGGSVRVAKWIENFHYLCTLD